MTDNQVWHCAVKNTTTTKEKWYYHLFYDFDGIVLKEHDVNYLVSMSLARAMSFILRKTMHGYHYIGLTPLDSEMWGKLFAELQNRFPTYHDGQAIRITKKMQDEFITVAENYDYPYVLNLAKLFAKFNKDGFNGNEIKQQWYVLLYYTTNKKNIKNKEVIGVNNRT